MTMRRSLLVSSCLLVAACRDLPKPAPIPAPIPVAVAPAATAAPAPIAATPPMQAIPTLTEEELAPGGVHPSAVFAVEGAVVVVDGRRIGRIVGDGIEWLAETLPNPAYDGLGPILVTGVYGRWPDLIGVTYVRENGRMEAGRYFPLTGVGLGWSCLLGFVVGVAQVGESTIAVGNNGFWVDNYHTVRGTAKRKPRTRKDANCKDPTDDPAIDAEAVGATRGGTMVTIGSPCAGPGPAAEIWDKHGTPRTVSLAALWRDSGRIRVLQGEGDELWATGGPWNALLRFHEGAFEALPDLGSPIKSPIRKVFTSRQGVLHVSDGRFVHRLDAGGWTPVAILPPGRVYTQMVMDDQGTIWVTSETVRRLRPGPAMPVPSGCATPFVYLYGSSSVNGNNYTYPTTRKALSSFPEAGALRLVEFVDDSRRLGVVVTSAAQGEALIAHIHETMKDESPRLFCFDPSMAKSFRNIALR